MPSLGVWAWQAAIGRHDASRIFLVGVFFVKVCTFFVGGARVFAGYWLLRSNPSIKRNALKRAHYVKQRSHILPRMLNIKAIITSFLFGFTPIAILSVSTFLWGFLFGGYNETFKNGAFVFSIIIIIGAPLVTGYVAASRSIKFRYLHGLISVLLVFIAAFFLTSLQVAVWSALALLASALPQSMLFVFPDSVLLGYFDGTILLLVLFCTFGAIGVFVFQKTYKFPPESLA